MGCILSELLHGTQEYEGKSEYKQDERFLFPGSSCFPLSPCDDMNEEANQEQPQVNIVSQNDQMIKILEVLGKQESHTDYSFIMDDGVLNYQ